MKKQILTTFLALISLTSFCCTNQQSDSSFPKMHDTIVVVQAADTTIVGIEYVNNDFVKYQEAIVIRKGFFSKAWIKEGGWHNTSVQLYDFKFQLIPEKVLRMTRLRRYSPPKK